jgi:hypothetical protein
MKHSLLLKLAVLIASISQVAAAYFMNIGTFDTTERTLPVFIQPAGWAFSIWGLIYLFSFIYAVYQLVPQYDNAVLRATRAPALVAFVGSIVWLYFAGTGDWQTWFTAPVLFLVALVLTRVVQAPRGATWWQTTLSKKLLYPYAAWTGIAAWLNIQTLITDKGIVTSDTTNIATNLVLFVCVAAFTFYYYKRTEYSAFYGGVLVWAGVAVVAANLSGGMTLFAVLGGAFAAVAAGVYLFACFRAERQRQ